MVSLSIVTPVWNDIRVKRAVNSVRAQINSSDVEVIIVDGGSTGKCKVVLDEISADVDILISEPDKGIYDAMNKGVRLASGEIIGILNADDMYCDPLHFEKVRNAVISGAQATYSDIEIKNPKEEIARKWTAGKYSRRKWRLGWMPPHPSVFISKRLYEQHGLYRTDLRLAADYELMLRIFYKYRIDPQYIPSVAVHMASGGASDTSIKTLREGWNQVRSAWQLNGIRGGTIAATSKPLSKVGQLRLGFMSR